MASARENPIDSRKGHIMIRYYVDRSGVCKHPSYFKRWRNHKPSKDPCLGCFQQHYGKFDLPVFGDDIESVLTKELDDLQSPYCIDSAFDEDFVIVPTVRSIKSGEIPIQFRINHSSKDPTHVLDWVLTSSDYPDSHPVFVGKKELSPDTEVTFDYNLR